MKPKVRAPQSREYQETVQLVRHLNLHTVCEEAACPNIGECWKKKHAAFMILGDTCTRCCQFCNVKTGTPCVVNDDEPRAIAEAIARLNLAYVVVTSVTRDDLSDGGAAHFAKTVEMIRWISPSTKVEILTPDFLRKDGAIDIIAACSPDVFNHNLETVSRLYKKVRPAAKYQNSLDLLRAIKEKNPKIWTKSGIMVGLGEAPYEVFEVMDDLRSARVDFLTIGQYLQPTPQHYPVAEFVSEKQFDEYKSMAQRKGFLMVSASALTRSSYHAGEDFEKLLTL